MRTFLVSLLKDLKRLTGVKQYEDMCYVENNDESKRKAQEELDLLLTPMIEVCNQYSYISDEDKMKIIKAAVINAKEFYGLNARFVRLALEQVKDVYWKESGYLETNALLNAKESNAVPLEECSPETQAMVKEFTAKLAAGGIQKITPANEHELKSIQTEDQERVKKEAKSAGYDWRTKSEQINAEKARLKVALESRGLDKLTDLSGLKPFEIEGIAVWARNKEEAQEIYLEVYI